MQQLFTYLSAILLILISMLHFYWIFGGRRGLQSSLPQRVDGGVAANPGWIVTFIVAMGLMGMAFILLAQNNLIPYVTPNFFTKWSCLIITFIFLLRAIGDFKYMGLSKKIKNTDFSKYDTKLYTPLCLFLGWIFMFSWSF
ncbi:DUF3995 domain-containing protein [Ureibacillus sinduriensis]|uniref:DUF3995 domain-containing protein n=1 Tax=Ureibacillus sinduriensis BLB-1 = JCM 15800 TaxID=1384057 RepID=A0A0A3I109_9BACL|nr:DUF3995 domain-containing protein [Ureibacillus sinduriensis]KGR77185.1 hypothetical protein CD33_03480 [Ureibacillus sinduriensis BLB-1 = JCM 15800]